MSLPLDPKRADILLRALAREHLALRADGVRCESVKDLMREIVKIAFGIHCGPAGGSLYRSPVDRTKHAKLTKDPAGFYVRR